MSLDIPDILDRLRYRYPSLLVDSVIEHDPNNRIVALKNVTVNEEFFQGHFPGTPLMPGVMMIETLAQVATLLLFHNATEFRNARAVLHGVNNARFRRQVLPGDHLSLELTLISRDENLAITKGVATVGKRTVAEAELLIGFEYDFPEVHETAIVHSSAVLSPKRAKYTTLC